MRFASLKPKPAGTDQGIVMVVTLAIGLLLLAGATGLMARMLMSRKLGSSESYQQMAETAALNGFNRLLGSFNKDDKSQYRGYFYTLNDKKGDWLWPTANNRPSPSPLQGLCTDTSIGLPAVQL